MPGTTLNKLTALCAELQAAEGLAAVDLARKVSATASELEVEYVRAARSAGVSWSKIGAVFGLSKQGAQQRFAKHKKHGNHPAGN